MKKILISGFFILIMTISFLLVACTNNNVNNNNNTDSSENLQGQASGMLPVADDEIDNNDLDLEAGGSVDCVAVSSNCQDCKQCCGRERGSSRCSSRCQMAFTSTCN